jgi:rubrerythrin
MSIVESMLKLIDPVQAQAREEERRVAREQPKRDDAGDPPTFVCRVCGHRDPQGSYCPTCLADTMERVSTTAKAARSE